MHRTATPGAHPSAGAALALTTAGVVAQAHARSQSFGLQPHEQADLHLLDRQTLAWTVARNEALCAHARPVMETLAQQLRGTQSMVMLTDAQGVILHAEGDDAFLDRAGRVALQPGAGWSERSKGTNAIGTALALGDAVQINGRQHYLEANQFLTCSCAPILDPQGQILGALDVSGDRRGHSAHTLALVRMSAAMVENHLFGKVYEDAVRLRFHARAEFLGTLMEGLAAFTPQGRFLAANRSAQFQLGLSGPALAAHTFTSLFGLSMGALLEHARRSVPTLLALQLPAGVSVHAQVEFAPRGGVTLPVCPDGPAEAPPPRARPAAAPGLSSLRYLDTGDAQLAQVIERVTRLLGRGVPTMILGETGTGKELLARAIHNDGPRARGPFVAVNCASIPESLIEAELFGYEEGAFTGARRKGSVGKIVQAHGGTLFLDEVGDIPLTMQVKLLRLLESGTYRRVGHTELRRADIRLVAATHRDLRAMVREGRFRQDLYYRLSTFPIQLPALRERPQDIPLLAESLLQRVAGGRGLVLAPAALRRLAQHPFPGNVRELRNVLDRAALLTDGAVVAAHTIERALSFDAPAAAPARAAQQPDHATLRDIESEALRAALAGGAASRRELARALGVSTRTLYRKLRLLREQG